MTNQRLPLGNRSGVNFIAACMLPLILSFPCMKAVWGLSFPVKRSTASLSTRLKVASALPCLPYWMDPFPFLRSTVQQTGSLPLASGTSKWKTALTFLTTSAPLVAKWGFILSKRTATFRDIYLMIKLSNLNYIIHKS